MKNAYKKRIDEANVYDAAIKTPLQKQVNLSNRFNNNIFLKREDLQPVFSFKVRGAYNKMANLSKDELARGVISCSAGNHAQGVALAAQKLDCKALIVMPSTTPLIKIKAVEGRGAEVVLHGHTYHDAYNHAVEIQKKESLTFIHPFDDPDVIAGQGTVAKEILADCPDNIHAIFICVGGGGLIAGIAAYIKAVRPDIKIIGVEAQDADAMTQSLKANRRVLLENVSLFAEGAAVKQVGEENFKLCQEYVDEMIVVSNDEICAAIKDVFEDTRTILETAGALAVAGIKSYIKKNNIKSETLIGTASGANMNFDRLGFVAERAEIGEERETVFAVTIPENPGAFKSFCSLIGSRSITEFNYRFSSHSSAHIFVGISVRDFQESKLLIKTLNDAGLEAIDLTHNEVAKLHLRHLVGGHAPEAENEVIYRFEFPERPGALSNFLNNMGENWNISLFHYRNHGADIGRVLVGIQVPPNEKETFQIFLSQVGYPSWDETGNPAYKLFLGN
ncbi:MAG: threonine ammonia-lyase, biosynthetic [Betaproteobacteria bacterium]|nr:threonine ammonia-lyase, biosynthetic [Betaproteobacteria bacterium]MCH9842345.1 threonine ammonia-lyase, biosynthetic [Betaproteobacteria bacterium]MDC0877597.1 threonine ammonia-lyase, biosynthetic [Methylophilaceae bacterium]